MSARAIALAGLAAAVGRAPVPRQVPPLHNSDQCACAECRPSQPALTTRVLRRLVTALTQADVALHSHNGWRAVDPFRLRLLLCARTALVALDRRGQMSGDWTLSTEQQRIFASVECSADILMCAPGYMALANFEFAVNKHREAMYRAHRPDQPPSDRDVYQAAVGVVSELLGSPTPNPAAPLRLQCVTCRGTGVDGAQDDGNPLGCMVCHGTGVAPLTDPDNRWRRCPSCNGLGVTDHGLLVCARCRGVGQLDQNAAAPAQTIPSVRACEACQGTGSLPNSERPCPACLASGQLHETETICARCHGSGSNASGGICPACRGAGLRQDDFCRMCTGSGIESLHRNDGRSIQIPCHVCGGSGRQAVFTRPTR